MAKVELVSLVDDLDGTELDPADAHTVAWSWLGIDYRLDVSTVNLDKIENGKVPIARVLEASTRIGGRRQSTAPRITTSPPATRQRRVRSRQGARGVDPAQVREWAVRNGFDVAPRGRIAGNIVEAYRASV